jgi:hypothetical protein
MAENRTLALRILLRTHKALLCQTRLKSQDFEFLSGNHRNNDFHIYTSCAATFVWIKAFQFVRL